MAILVKSILIKKLLVCLIELDLHLFENATVVVIKLMQYGSLTHLELCLGKFMGFLEDIVTDVVF